MAESSCMRHWWKVYCCTTMEHGVCQKMIRENWTVFTETSWETLLGSSGHKISNEKLYIRSQEQNHFQLQSQKGDWSCLDTFWDFQMTVLQEKLWDIILRRGTRRTTIVTTLKEDIKRTRENDNTFRVTPLISQVSLQNIYTKAKNRKKKEWCTWCSCLQSESW